MAGLGAAILAFGVLVGACGSTAAPAAPSAPRTTYDSHAWSVSLPDDLGLTPINRDPDAIWISPSIMLTGTGESKRNLAFQVFDLETLSCDQVRMTAWATSLRDRLTYPESNAPVDLPVDRGFGSVFTGRPFDLDSTVIVACEGRNVINMLGMGLDRSQLEGVFRTFTWRVPRGDPLDRPTPAASS